MNYRLSICLRLRKFILSENARRSPRNVFALLAKYSAICRTGVGLLDVRVRNGNLMSATLTHLGRIASVSRIGIGPRARKFILLAGALFLSPLLPLAILRFIPPLTTPLMMIRSHEGYHIERQWVSLRAISPYLRRAAIYAEDNRFCEETSGIDFDALSQAAGVWLDGKRSPGASTITMQTARSLFLWPGRSYFRKLMELWITPQMALLWPKHRVLEVYLNIAEFGPGLFGVQAAAQHYFNKDASQLGVIEATKLIAVLPDPLHRTPATLEPRVLRGAELATLPVFVGDSEFDCGNP